VGRIRWQKAPVQERPVEVVDAFTTRKRQGRKKAAEKGHEIGEYEEERIGSGRFTARCAHCHRSVTVVVDTPERYTPAAATYALRGDALHYPCT